MTEAALSNDRHLTYQRRMKYCTRATCTACRSGTPSHGPYWYACWREGTRVRSRYLGKQAPPGHVSATEGELAPAVAEGELAPAVAPAPAQQQPPLRIQTFGRLAAWRGAEPVPERCWKRRKAAALLGILLSQPEFRLHREQVIDLLWPGITLEIAQGRLWSTLHRLREILDVPGVPGSHLCWIGDQLTLVRGEDAGTGSAWIDAATFDQLADRALAGSDVQLCRQAIERYGEDGDYLSEFAYEDWAIRRREYLRNRLVAVLFHGATLLQEEGAPEEAERLLRRTLTVEPSNERAAYALMTQLLAQGRSADGLRVYRELTAHLEELGVGPEPETKRIGDRLEQALQSPVATTILPPRPEDARLTNLPTPISSFVGRAKEHAEIDALLRSSRLLTLTGIGGVGKTRLALAVAAAQVSAYVDGVWLADLSALPVGETAATVLLCQTVARALGIQEQAGEPLLQTLIAFLRPRELLLVLDNCEHLITACAELVQAVLAACPRLTVLVTSREPLTTAGETIWRVPPLGVPDMGQGRIEDVRRSEAVQLFMARARAKRSDFTLTQRNALAVAQVCTKLEGIPLSLELAAARLTMLSVEQLAARLDDRLQLLTGGSRATLPRQQTLRAALHWSYSLLNEPERVLLRRLSVFAGGCDLDAIEAICAGSALTADSVLDIVGSLVGKSLVLAETQEERARYRLLETVREYGHEHLVAWGEEDAFRERHCGWYAALAEQARPQLRSAEQKQWLNRLDLEYDNIRAALEWSVGHPGAGDYGLRFTFAMWQFWYMRDYITEGRSWLGRILATSDSRATALRAEALNGAGTLAYLQSDESEAARLLEEGRRCAQCAGDRVAEARALANLANLALGQGDYAPALSRYQETAKIFREYQDLPNTATSVYNIGITWLNLGNDEEAEPFLVEAVQLFRSLGFKLGLAKALTNLASLLRQRGDLEQARVALEESMSHLRESGDHSYKGDLSFEMGALAEACGEYPEALTHFQEALRLAFASQDEPGCREAMEGVAWVSAVACGGEGERAGRDQERSMRQDEPSASLSAHSAQRREALEYAARLLAASNGQVTTTRQPRHPRYQAEYDARVRTIRAALGDELFTPCWTAGVRLTREAALSLALSGPPLVRDVERGESAPAR